MPIYRHCVATLPFLVLTACGGGGSSDEGPAAPQAAVLTPSNYTVASQEALASMGFVDTTVNSLPGAKSVPADGSGGATQPPAVDILVALLGQVTKAVFTDTAPCAGGGSLTVSVNDANNNEDLDAGDSATVTANNCNQSGTVLGGRMSFSVVRLMGDLTTTAYTGSFNYTLDGFSVRTASSTVVGSGAMSVDLQSRGNNTASATVRISNLTQAVTPAGNASATTRTLTSFNSSTTRAPAATVGYTTTARSDGTVSSSALDGRAVTLATVTPFVTNGSSLFPASGQVTLAGGAGSRVRITAQNASTVLLELDVNGDGGYESSTTRTWSQLR